MDGLFRRGAATSEMKKSGLRHMAYQVLSECEDCDRGNMVDDSAKLVCPKSEDEEDEDLVLPITSDSKYIM